MSTKINPKNRKFTIKVNDKGEPVGLQIDGKEVATKTRPLPGYYDLLLVEYKGFRGADETLRFKMVKGKPIIDAGSSEIIIYKPKPEFIEFVPSDSKAADKAKYLNDAIKPIVKAPKPAPAPARAPAADNDKTYRLGESPEPFAKIPPLPSHFTPLPPEMGEWFWNKYHGYWQVEGEQPINDGESVADYIKRIKRNRSQRTKKASAAAPAAPPLAPIKGKFAPQLEEIPERDEPLIPTAVPARKKFITKKMLQPPTRPLSEFEKAKKIGWGLIHHIYRFHKITEDYKPC